MDKKKKDKLLSCFGAVAFLLIFAVILNTISFVLTPKENGRNSGLGFYSATGCYSEKNNSLDVVFLGNSNIYCSVSPMEIWNSYGITSYNCGAPLLRISDVYYNFSKLLKTQKPKVAVLETDAFFSLCSGTQDLEKTISGFFNNTFPTVEYHDRWKSISKADFSKKPKYSTHVSEKGYVYSNAIEGYSGEEDYMKPTADKEKIKPSSILYFEKLCKLCDDNGVQLVLVSVPSPECWNSAKHNAVDELAQKHQLVFIDLNITDIGMDFSQDTRDGGTHLNHLGAGKVTAFVGEYLKSNYNLSDYRNNESFVQWNSDYDVYLNDIKNESQSKT